MAGGVTSRPYLQVVQAGPDALHFAVTDAHPRNNRYNRVFAFTYRRGAFRGADGRVLGQLGGPPFPVRSADGVYFAHQERQGRAWLLDLAAGDDGHPVVLFQASPRVDDHRHRYARWDGSGYTSRELAAAGGSMSPTRDEHGYTAGGGALDKTDPRTVYLSLPVRPRAWRLQRWTTRDGGSTWQRAWLTATGDTSSGRCGWWVPPPRARSSRRSSCRAGTPATRTQRPPSTRSAPRPCSTRRSVPLPGAVGHGRVWSRCGSGTVRAARGSVVAPSSSSCRRGGTGRRSACAGPTGAGSRPSRPRLGGAQRCACSWAQPCRGRRCRSPCCRCDRPAAPSCGRSLPA